MFALLRFKEPNLPSIKDMTGKEPRYCKHCNKQEAWTEIILIETTARTYNSWDRTYDIAGEITFHMDGTRCSEERLRYEKLAEPIVHKDLKKWSEG